MNPSTLSHNALNTAEKTALTDAVLRDVEKMRRVIRAFLIRYGRLKAQETDDHIDDVFQDVVAAILSDLYVPAYEGRSIDDILCFITCAVAREHVNKVYHRKERTLDVEESSSTAADISGCVTVSAEDTVIDNIEAGRTVESVFAGADALRLKVGGDIVLYALLKGGVERGIWCQAVIDGVLIALFGKRVLTLATAECVSAAATIAGIVTAMSIRELKASVRKRGWLPDRVIKALSL